MPTDAAPPPSTLTARGTKPTSKVPSPRNPRLKARKIALSARSPRISRRPARHSPSKRCPAGIASVSRSLRSGRALARIAAINPAETRKVAASPTTTAPSPLVA